MWNENTLHWYRIYASKEKRILTHLQKITHQSIILQKTFRRIDDNIKAMWQTEMFILTNFCTSDNAKYDMFYLCNTF